MKVFNLRDYPIAYKGKMIAPNGGSVDIVGMGFIPDRDLELAKQKVLAFGTLPEWWIAERQMALTPPVAAKIAVPVAAKIEVNDVVAVEEKLTFKKK